MQAFSDDVIISIPEVPLDDPLEPDVDHEEDPLEIDEGIAEDDKGNAEDDKENDADLEVDGDMELLTDGKNYQILSLERVTGAYYMIAWIQINAHQCRLLESRLGLHCKLQI